MKNGMIRKATKSFVGRVLRRLLGEEKGAVMMEYIVVALLIAAACVLGVAFFGHHITEMFGSLAYSTGGRVEEANKKQKQSNDAIQGNFEKASKHNQSKREGGAEGTDVGAGGSYGK